MEEINLINMFKILVLISGILVLTALFNSLVGEKKFKWFPGDFKVLKEINKDSFKKPKDLIFSLNSIVTAEGILGLVGYIILLMIYSVLVYYLI